MTVKSLRKQLAAAIAMTLVATVALGSSTYAWFVSNTQVTASQVNVTASTTYALQISQDDGTNIGAWTTACTLTNEASNDKYSVYLLNDGQTSSETQPAVIYEDKAHTGNYYKTSDFLESDVLDSITIANYHKSASATLRPVSTVGFANDAAADGMVFYKENAWKNDAEAGNAGNHASGFETAATTDYFKTTFKIKASQICDLRLDSGNTSFDSASAGMKQVLRMALVVKGSDSKYNAFIYQIDGTAGTVHYNTTHSTEIGSGVLGIDKAINAVNSYGEIQAHNLVSSAVPVYDATGIMVNGDPTSLVAAAADATEAAQILYHFKEANDVCEVTVYLWMEGCDAECNADMINQFNGAANELVARLGFCAANEYVAP